MKPEFQNTLLMTLIAFSLLMTADPLFAEVYKTVDENGNVIYTDRPPGDGSAPMDLPELSVIEAPVYQKTARQAALEGEKGGETEVTLKSLRQKYRDFAITSPTNEESIWSPEQAIPVAWSVTNPLAAGMTVTLSVDGKEQVPTTQPIIPVADLERGEHTLTAELKDANNRRVATAQPVTFFIRQPNIYTNRARPGG